MYYQSCWAARRGLSGQGRGTEPLADTGNLSCSSALTPNYADMEAGSHEPLTTSSVRIAPRHPRIWLIAEAPLCWYSHVLACVNSSTFGSPSRDSTSKPSPVNSKSARVNEITRTGNGDARENGLDAKRMRGRAVDDRPSDNGADGMMVDSKGPCTLDASNQISMTSLLE
ncbi:hypothetical protein WG66_005600 [Moniliophthora roreri]|nr:hypothetical protein WG66_005600 [Moniliophthora roreri]